MDPQISSTSLGNHKTRQGSPVGLESLKIGLDGRHSVWESTWTVSRHLVEVLRGLVPHKSARRAARWISRAPTEALHWINAVRVPVSGKHSGACNWEGRRTI